MLWEDPLGGYIICYISRAQNYSWERVIEAMIVVMERMRNYYRGAGAKTWR